MNRGVGGPTGYCHIHRAGMCAFIRRKRGCGNSTDHHECRSVWIRPYVRIIFNFEFDRMKPISYILDKHRKIFISTY